MTAYIREYIIGHQWGYSYVITNFALSAGVVILLRNFSGWRKALLEVLGGCAVYLALVSAYFAAFGNWQMDRLVLVAYVILYSLLRSSYDRKASLVRGAMYVAGSFVIVPISEPIGNALKSAGADSMGWAQYLTAVIVVLMVVVLVWYLRLFSLDGKEMIYNQYVAIQCLIAVITIAMELFVAVSGAAEENRAWNVLMCLSFWGIGLASYYLFYSACQAVEQNRHLVALQKKNELEQEKFQITKTAYDELAVMRHEIKNHNFYLNELLREGKIEEAKEYLGNVTSRGDGCLKSYSSGNYAVDIVITHEINAAKEKGICLEPKILVPEKLPYPDEEVCSLLSNMLDNAIEAAAQCGKEAPVVTISMMPKQEYLFIRVTNPVDKTVPLKRRLSLETTKTEHAELHGYGTRIIRRIAEHYGGSVKFGMSDGNFVTDVMLELADKGAEDETLENSDL